MRKKKQGIALAMVAFGLYVVGGFGTFVGIYLIAFMSDRAVFGLGTGGGLGYLCLFVGLCLSILGVLLMRIFRNRGFS